MKKISAKNVRKRWSTSFCTVLRPDKKPFVLVLSLIIFLSWPQARAEVRLSLAETIRLAQEHSYGVKYSVYDSASAAYDYNSALSLRYPTLSLNAASFYINNLPSAQLGLKKMELGVHDNYQADFRLQVPLFTGGKISHQIGIQKENIQFKSMNLESERLNAAYQSRKAYLSLLLSQSLVGSAGASLERIRIIAADVRNLHSAGLADSVDILEADLAYQKALRLSVEKEMNKRNASLLLAQQIGLPATEEIVPLDTAPQPPPLDTTGQITDSSQISRPELKALDSRIRTANLLISLSGANYFPNLSGYAGYSTGKPNNDMFNKTWRDYFNIGLALNWEFNLGGKTHNSTLSARQLAFSARIAKSRLTETFTLQAGIAQENLHYAHQAYAIAQKELEITTHEFRLAKEKQQAGKLSVNRLLEMEADLTSAEQMYRASIINYFISETEYLYAIGAPKIYGGF
jgi:outer membrane protein